MNVPALEKEWISLINTSKTPLHATQERNKKKLEEEEEEEKRNSNIILMVSSSGQKPTSSYLRTVRYFHENI
jgi:hypothetical protein